VLNLSRISPVKGRTLLIITVLSLSFLGIYQTGESHAVSNPVNVISNPNFEGGAQPCGSVPAQQCPTDWDFATCEGVTNATLGLDSSQWTNGLYSAKVSTGPLNEVGCFPGNYTGRGVGFSQFRTQLRGSGFGYNFTSLTDDPNEFSFWFKLEPYNTNGMAGFEVRLFGAESIAEMDYVINPDPSIGIFQNSSQTHALTFTGYNYDQWYQFKRNIKADWASAGLSLTYNFTLIQFQGFATKTGNITKSETYWIDDVRVYVGTGPIPVEKYYANPLFEDSNNNSADTAVKWTLTNAMGQTVPYVQGQSTLPPGPYYLSAYFRNIDPGNLILTQQIQLNQSTILKPPLYPTSLVAGGYVALSNPAISLTINTPDPIRTMIELRGNNGTQYRLTLDVPSAPLLLQANGGDLNQGSDWTYDTTLSIVRTSFITGPAGENFTIFLREPTLTSQSFVDINGAPISSPVTFIILDSQDRTVPYIPGTILPIGAFYVDVYYAGFKIYRYNLGRSEPPPVRLMVSPLDPASNSYVAVNSTVTTIHPTQFSSSQIGFDIKGNGGYLVILNVPKRPLYVEINGTRTPDWFYNSTEGVISVDATGFESFLVVLEPPAINYVLYVETGGIAAIAISLIVFYFRRRKTQGRFGLQVD